MADRLTDIICGLPLHVLTCLEKNEGRALAAAEPARARAGVRQAVRGAPWPRELRGQMVAAFELDLEHPTGLARLASGNLIVGDYHRCELVEFTPGGAVVRRIKAPGDVRRPTAVLAAVVPENGAPAERLYVACAAERRVVEFRGGRAVRHFGQPRPARFSEVLPADRFRLPRSMAIWRRAGAADFDGAREPLLIIVDVEGRRVTAWRLNGDLWGILGDSAGAAGAPDAPDALGVPDAPDAPDASFAIYYPRTALSVGAHLVVFDSPSRDNHTLSPLRVQVLAWGRRAPAVVYSLLVPGRMYEISAEYMPLDREDAFGDSQTQTQTQNWTSGRIVASDASGNRVLVFAWRPHSPVMLELVHVFGGFPVLSMPWGIAVTADSVWVVNTGNKQVCVFEAQ